MTDNVEITTLANGLRVVSEDMPRLQTASLGVWVDVGTRYEPAEVNGVAHLLEHMAFKGTERRSARAIAEEIERVGGSLNAYTSREHTAYYARILAGDVELAADILADILQHSSFDPGELEKERHVVLQEIGQVKDTPDDLVRGDEHAGAGLARDGAFVRGDFHHDGGALLRVPCAGGGDQVAARGEAHPHPRVTMRDITAGVTAGVTAVWAAWPSPRPPR